MTRLFKLWEGLERPPVRRADKVSTFLLHSNEKFKLFILNASWSVYVVSGLLIICCFYYYVYDCQRRWEMKRRRQEAQRANERLPQRRRPGAAYRDHQIIRNVIHTVRQYIGSQGFSDRANKDANEVVRRTRSGAIYGRT